MTYTTNITSYLEHILYYKKSYNVNSPKIYVKTIKPGDIYSDSKQTIGEKLLYTKKKINKTTFLWELNLNIVKT